MRIDRRAFFGALVLCAPFACGGTAGSSASDAAAGDHACASGTVYCAGCGVGFCSTTCPETACPVAFDAGDGGSSGAAGSSEAGSSSGVGSSGGSSSGGADASTDAKGIFDAGAPDGTACPSAKPNYCTGCQGAGFCVAGPCLAFSCPVADAGPAPSPEGGACGSAPCGAGQLCVHPSCGGGASYPFPACSPAYDASACAPGWTFDAHCYSQFYSGPGCRGPSPPPPPPCMPPPPWCIDVPAACGGTPTCGCLSKPSSGVSSGDVCNGWALCLSGSIMGQDVQCGGQ